MRDLDAAVAARARGALTGYGVFQSPQFARARARRAAEDTRRGVCARVGAARRVRGCEARRAVGVGGGVTALQVRSGDRLGASRAGLPPRHGAARRGCPNSQVLALRALRLRSSPKPCSPASRAARGRGRQARPGCDARRIVTACSLRLSIAGTHASCAGVGPGSRRRTLLAAPALRALDAGARHGFAADRFGASPRRPPSTARAARRASTTFGGGGKRAAAAGGEHCTVRGSPSRARPSGCARQGKTERWRSAARGTSLRVRGLVLHAGRSAE